MGYSVKVQFPMNNAVEVSGDDVATVVNLLNEVTKKFFGGLPAAKIEI